MSEIERRKNNTVSHRREGYGRITDNDKWLPRGIMAGSATVVGALATLLTSLLGIAGAGLIAALTGIFFLATLVFGAQGANKLFIEKGRD